MFLFLLVTVRGGHLVAQVGNRHLAVEQEGVTQSQQPDLNR